jgi:ferredoxin
LGETNETSTTGDYATLVIRSETSPVPTGKAASLMSETIVVGKTRQIDDIVFQVNAKLGRLTRSDLAATKPECSPRSLMSRREFLFGLAKNIHRPNDVPIVLADSCEVRFGCSKCAEACPFPNALKIGNGSVIVSGEQCVGCGVCAGVCPVAAIQIPSFSEDAYRGLLAGIDAMSAPKKTLVITCNERSVASQPWVDVEQVHGVGAVGVRQVALAANSTISALLVYCPDGLCAGKQNAKRAANLISSVVGDKGPVIAYLEGDEGLVRISEIHRSARTTERRTNSTGAPWRDYVTFLKSTAGEQAEATGLGLIHMDLADSCTLCYGCVKSCPHEALTIQQSELIFQPEKCTGCGYCARICPEHSITLSAMDGPIQLSKRTVYQDEIISCARCHTPYVSAKLLKKVSEIFQGDDTITRLCPTCRQETIFEKTYRRTDGSHKAI